MTVVYNPSIAINEIKEHNLMCDKHRIKCFLLLILYVLSHMCFISYCIFICFHIECASKWNYLLAWNNTIGMVYWMI